MTRLVGFYPGSFDPLTNGHLDVIKQGLQLPESMRWWSRWARSTRRRCFPWRPAGALEGNAGAGRAPKAARRLKNHVELLTASPSMRRARIAPS